MKFETLLERELRGRIRRGLVNGLNQAQINDDLGELDALEDAVVRVLVDVDDVGAATPLACWLGIQVGRQAALSENRKEDET